MGAQMTPDEIQKDRETGTPGELAERLIRIKDGITHRADRDALSNAVNRLYALTAENAALKKWVDELKWAMIEAQAALIGAPNTVGLHDQIEMALEKRHE